MPHSYHIEEIVQQDASSVVYFAIEVNSGHPVALRRFFPFGIDGGGLEPDEQSAYQIALSRLAAISHPSLRPILGGGCDPVDGIPYIVTHWADGLTLANAVSSGEPEASLAVEWIMQALEVSELLSHVLTQQDIWVETDPTSILISDESDGYRASFRISPLKWLSGSNEPSWTPIVELTESIMSWQGKVVNDHAARGLGGWLKWLRDTPPTTSLQEVREMLAASVGVEPPPPTSKLVKHAIVAGNQLKQRRPPLKVTSQGSSSKWPVILATLLLIATSSLGVWLYLRPKPQTPPETAESTRVKVVKAIVPSAVSLTDGNPDSEDITDQADDTLEEDSTEPPDEAKSSVPPSPSDGVVYTVNDSSLLREKSGQIVTFEAVLKSVENTREGGVLMRFGSKSESSIPCGYISPRNANGDLSVNAIKRMQGKRIQIQGKVRNYKNRPDIQIHNRLSMHVVE